MNISSSIVALKLSVLALLLSGCMTMPQTNTASCLLGVPNGFEVLNSGDWGDPVDALITKAIDEGHDSWLCPPLSSKDKASLAAESGSTSTTPTRASLHVVSQGR